MSTTEGAADVVVLGSGAAGLAAALAAAVAGVDVTVLEAADVLGGGTSISGGAVWVPANHRAAEIGVEDSIEEARSYCREHSVEYAGALVETFLLAAPRMARFVEAHSPIRFLPMHYPDSFVDGAGGKQAGRNLEVAPLVPRDAERVGWPVPYPSVITNDELNTYRPHAGGQLPDDLLAQRTGAGQVTMGRGLVVGLVDGCTAAGVRFLRRCRAERLVLDDAGRAAGVEYDHNGALRRLPCGGVVLATGGFEHDARLVGLLHGQPVDPLSIPTNRGDGIRLAGAVGAQIVHTDQSWRWPALQVPGEMWDPPYEAASPRMLFAERTMPHAIWVNNAGRRFVNEASHNAMLAFDHVDARTGRLANSPAWVVCDAVFVRRYGLAGQSPDAPPPAWAHHADSLDELGRAAGVDPVALVQTVARFNEFVRYGADLDFGRGDSSYDRFTGDPDTPHPNLGDLAEPPFYALPLGLGVVGTKGGPRIDPRGRVLDWTGTSVPGLFAAGNVAGAVLGPGTLSNGASIGVAMTFGWLAGITAAGAAPELPDAGVSEDPTIDTTIIR